MKSFLTIAAMALVLAAVPACRPMTSQDTIYGNASREPDPATREPFLGVEGPGKADSPIQQPPPGDAMVTVPPPVRTYQSADLGTAQVFVRAWIDGVAPREALGSRTMRMDAPVSRQPKLKFEMTPELGQFRGAAVQIYRVANDQPDKDSGVRFQEDG
ncbi:MAG: hypothetical protein PHU85_15790, partial [Phycisphaerae bacterium]|nr:hypothetical protein [Phycisphaerae bacterium]